MGRDTLRRVHTRGPVDLLARTQTSDAIIARHTVRIDDARRLALNVVLANETTGARRHIASPIAQPFSAAHLGLCQQVPLTLNALTLCAGKHQQVGVIAVAPLGRRPLAIGGTQTLGLIGLAILIAVAVKIQQGAARRALVVDHIVAVIVHPVAALFLPGEHVVIGVLAIATSDRRKGSGGRTQTLRVGCNAIGVFVRVLVVQDTVQRARLVCGPIAIVVDIVTRLDGLRAHVRVPIVAIPRHRRRKVSLRSTQTHLLIAAELVLVTVFVQRGASDRVGLIHTASAVVVLAIALLRTARIDSGITIIAITGDFGRVGNGRRTQTLKLRRIAVTVFV